MEMNAREAMHLIELRTDATGTSRLSAGLPGDAPADRRQAGHHAIAEAMSFVDHSGGEAGRLGRRAGGREEAKRRLVAADGDPGGRPVHPDEGLVGRDGAQAERS